eukprot:m.169926 g.169926  ORF g.169926 m.169926 type:complete len:57 (+) comp16482_c1_seq1:1049-1219(+)
MAAATREIGLNVECTKHLRPIMPSDSTECFLAKSFQATTKRKQHVFQRKKCDVCQC